MDIERYQEVDAKIRPVRWVRRAGNRVEFGCRPRLAGLRIPGPTIAQWVELTPGRRIDIGLLPSRWTALVDFRASFEATPVDAGTQVDRTLTFRFSPWLRWLRPLLARRLPAEVRDELRRAKAYLERPAPDASSSPGRTSPTS
jgi:hypothetical protein